MKISPSRTVTELSTPGVPIHVIYLLRHAKSSWNEPELLDHERPLAKRGRKAVALLRGHAHDSGIAPDLVLCSSAARAIQTLEGVREGLPSEAVVEIEAGLYAAGAGSLLGRLRRLRCAGASCPDPCPSR